MKTEPLTKYLSALDKQRIKNYIIKYGGLGKLDIESILADDNYVDKWLANWAKNKKKLYRLFGNSFIITKKVEIKNTSGYLYKLYKNLLEDLDKNMQDEIEEYNFLDYLDSKWFYEEVSEMDIYYSKTGEVIFRKPDDESSYLERARHQQDIYTVFNRPFNFEYTLNDTPIYADSYFTGFETTLKKRMSNEKSLRIRRDLPNGKYKELRINKGEKIDKVQKKILDFIDFEERHPLYYKQYLYYIKRINEIKSTKSHSAILCFSIHPMDFMTMSDNDNHWSSCMNWTEDYEGGCYRIGSVEMMNSDNVVCAYLLSEKESKQRWNFGYYPKDCWRKEDWLYPDITEADNAEEWTWNNKSWRCLYYITKDILLSGKSYPYYQKEINFTALETLKDMVKERFNWDYKYGIQPYSDMTRANYHSFFNIRQMNNKVKGIDGRIKKNIYIETRGMYNDFLHNNEFTGYYCYRNPVKKTKIIMVSGEPLSIRTTEPFQLDYDGWNPNDEGEYNDRYGETDMLY